MERMRLALAFSGLLAGACGGAPSISSRAGEVHLHQYSTGAHLSALFLDPPTPLAQTEFDSALPSVNAPVFDDGTCRVFVVRTCTDCPALSVVDGGDVDVAGLPRPVDLAFHRDLGGYDDLVVDGQFLAGGAQAKVTSLGSERVPAFEASVRIPQPIAPSTTLESGLAGGLEVGWTPAGGDVKIALTVVPIAGDVAAVTCVADEAAGRFRMSDAALALLPPPPRQLQLEVSRYQLLDVPLGDGRGVVVHGGNAVLSAVSEP